MIMMNIMVMSSVLVINMIMIMMVVAKINGYRSGYGYCREAQTDDFQPPAIRILWSGKPAVSRCNL